MVLDVGAAPFRLASVDRTEGEAALVLASTCSSITKRLAFETDGNLALDLTWDTAEFPDGSTLATEFSLAHPRRLEPDAEAKVVRYDIITLARSERGFEHILQGEAVAVGWPTEDATAT